MLVVLMEDAYDLCRKHTYDLIFVCHIHSKVYSKTVRGEINLST